jgi:hypothetical protein
VLCCAVLFDGALELFWLVCQKMGQLFLDGVFSQKKSQLQKGVTAFQV